MAIEQVGHEPYKNDIFAKDDQTHQTAFQKLHLAAHGLRSKADP